MTPAEDIFLETSFGKLHAIKMGSGGHGIPMVFIPGMLGKADDWLNDLEAFQPRECVALSLRGRGQSDYPKNGFSVFDHRVDIETLVNALGYEKFILVGFSQGALYAVAYAQKYPDRVAALVIQDKGLTQKKFGQEWIRHAIKHPEATGKNDLITAIANESQDLDLLASSEVLSEKLILIIKGEHSFVLADEELQRMETAFKNCRIEIFPNSSHDVSSPDYEYYLRTMKDFLESNHL